MKKIFAILLLFAVCASASSLLVLSGSPPAATGWAPTTPSNTLRWWIKADALSLSDNDPVQTWTASAGPNATQATSGSRPLYKTNIRNGLPVVRFDGTNDFMATAAFGSAQAQPYTALIIYQLRTDPNPISVRLWDGIADPGRFLLRLNVGFQIYSGSAFVNLIQFSTTTWHTLLIVVNGASTTWSWDGAADTTEGNNPGTQNVTGITLGDNMGGGVNPAAVDFLEFIIWDGTLSAGDRTSALAYARARGATW